MQARVAADAATDRKAFEPALGKALLDAKKAKREGKSLPRPRYDPTYNGGGPASTVWDPDGNLVKRPEKPRPFDPPV